MELPSANEILNYNGQRKVNYLERIIFKAIKIIQKGRKTRTKNWTKIISHESAKYKLIDQFQTIKDAYTELNIEIPIDFVEQMRTRNTLNLRSMLSTTIALNLNCDGDGDNCESKSVKWRVIKGNDIVNLKYCDDCFEEKRADIDYYVNALEKAEDKEKEVDSDLNQLELLKLNSIKFLEENEYPFTHLNCNVYLITVDGNNIKDIVYPGFTSSRTRQYEHLSEIEFFKRHQDLIVPSSMPSVQKYKDWALQLKEKQIIKIGC